MALDLVTGRSPPFSPARERSARFILIPSAVPVPWPGVTRDTVIERPDEAGDSLVGASIGQYRVTHEIGRGGMGVVYHAVHRDIGQRAAVKVLSARLAQDRAAMKRFLNEARAVSLVRHPGLVKIFDFGETAQGTPYILMELLDGESLFARLRRLHAKGVAIDRDDAVRITRQIASALIATHEQGIVHRDLKPDNVMLVPDEEAPSGERVKLLDFGIARFIAEAEQATAQTSPGTVIGTAAYMSPEQCAGSDQIDGASDVYSLGVMLYELLGGRLPFRGDGASMMRQHLFQEPPPLRELAPSSPVELWRLVHRMLAKEPSRRPTIDRVAEELRPVERAADGATEPAPAPSFSETEDKATANPGASLSSVTTRELPTGTTAAPSPPRPRRRHWAAMAAVIALLGGGGLLRLTWGPLPSRPNRLTPA